MLLPFAVDSVTGPLSIAAMAERLEVESERRDHAEAYE
jgi:hypothetical protein